MPPTTTLVPVLIVVATIGCAGLRIWLNWSIQRVLSADDAVFDQHTGAYRRAAYERRLAIEHARCDRTGSPLVIRSATVTRPSDSRTTIRWAVEHVGAGGSVVQLDDETLAVLVHAESTVDALVWAHAGLELGPPTADAGTDEAKVA